MTDIKQTEDGDIFLDENGQSYLVDGVEEAAQKNYQHLQTFQGEWFIDRSIGVPYFDLMDKTLSIDSVSATLKREIISIPCNSVMTRFDLSRSVDRRLRVSYAVLTLDGDLVTIERDL